MGHMGRIYNNVFRATLTVAAAITLTALGSCQMCHGGKPDSGGRPYEAMVVGDDDSTICRALATPVDALPQQEPQFDATCIGRDRFKGVVRLARNIVVVSIDPTMADTTTVSCRRDVYATPQTVVYVGAPSAGRLRRDSTAIRKAIRLLAAGERSMAIDRLRQHHNPRMEAEVRRMFGITMLIPPDMTACRRGQDFIWMSNNSPTAMQNICIYTGSNRDSTMRRNIKGETDDMYMATTPDTTHTYTMRTAHTRRTITRGLWHMHGDAMGGPFAAHTMHIPDKRKTITAEAFVYAPATRKRNPLMQAEASLYTIK